MLTIAALAAVLASTACFHTSRTALRGRHRRVLGVCAAGGDGRGDGREEALVEIKAAGPKGMGAFASRAIAKGAWVCRYHGVEITLLETQLRYVEEEPEYLFMLNETLYLDAQESGHFSRFFNHEEHGNLDFEVDDVTRRVDFYAARAIEPGEELTFDYSADYWTWSAAQPAPGTDSRDFSLPPPPEGLPPPPPGPRPLTPTTLTELARTTSLDDEEARLAVLRALEYFGATRLGPSSLRVPFGVGADASWQEVDPGRAPLELLRRAAVACISAVEGL